MNNMEIYKQAWAILYMIFSEQMNDKSIAIMDKVLNNCIEKDDVNYQTAWTLLKFAFIATNDKISLNHMNGVLVSVSQEIRHSTMCELIK